MPNNRDGVPRTVFDGCYSPEPGTDVVLHIPKLVPRMQILPEEVEEYAERLRIRSYPRNADCRTFCVKLYRALLALVYAVAFYLYTIKDDNATTTILILRVILAFLIHVVFFMLCKAIEKSMKKMNMINCHSALNDHVV